MHVPAAASRSVAALRTAPSAACRAFSTSPCAAAKAAAPAASSGVPEVILRGHTRSIKFGRKHAAGERGVATTQHPLGPLPGSAPVPFVPAPPAALTSSGSATYFGSIAQLGLRFNRPLSEEEIAVVELGGAFPDPPKPPKDDKAKKAKK